MVENVNASKYWEAYSTSIDYETLAMTAEFKLAINSYLKQLVVSKVRYLKDLIAFNNKFSKLVSISYCLLAHTQPYYSNFEHIKILGTWDLGLMQEKTKEYGQQDFLDAEATNGIGQKEKEAIIKLAKMSRDGFEKLMEENKLDALLSPFSVASSILARGQYPGIIVPAGYDRKGLPFGLCFGGLKGSEPTLIEIAYAFEQATKIRRPPSFKH